MMKLVFATHNQNKVKEISALLPDHFHVLSLDEIDFRDEIPETARTLEGNASIKAQTIYDQIGVNCFADDSGLEIDALHMEPGVHSARYAGEQRNDDANMDLVLERLHGKSNRTAQFRTVIILIIDGTAHSFEGIIRGTITEEKRGKEGFGYDPIFKPDGFNKTFAQMGMTEKNAISHRSRAFEKMINFLKAISSH